MNGLEFFIVIYLGLVLSAFTVDFTYVWIKRTYVNSKENTTDGNKKEVSG